MRYGFDAVSPSKDRGNKNPVWSWSVYVFDSSRNAFPPMWPVAVFRSENDARVVWEQLKAKYADAKNLYFYLEPSEGEPRDIIQYFEKKFGPCPESLRLVVPRANLKAGGIS